jgi:hypothetical protein
MSCVCVFDPQDTDRTPEECVMLLRNQLLSVFEIYFYFESEPLKNVSCYLEINF